MGASKTHALITDLQGRVLGAGHAGPGNHQGVGLSGLTATVQRASAAALAEARLTTADLRGAGLGLAGFDWESQRPALEAAVRAAGLSGPLALVNDAALGLLAGCEHGVGVALVAGTGCNARGRDAQGREGRVSGEGAPFGEGAGGSELVGRAFQAVSRAWSRRGPASVLEEVLPRFHGLSSAAELLEAVSTARLALDPAAAPLIFAAAQGGDAVALGLLGWAGAALADLALGVIRQLEFGEPDFIGSFEVVLVGSLFNGGPLLLEPLGRALHAGAPGARLRRLNAPPVVGAVRLGFECAGLPLSPENWQRTEREGRERLYQPV